MRAGVRAEGEGERERETMRGREGGRSECQPSLDRGSASYESAAGKGATPFSLSYVALDVCMALSNLLVPWHL